MDTYIKNKCVQSGCLPSLYVDESTVITLGQKLACMNIEIIRFVDISMRTETNAGIQMKLVHIRCRDDSQQINSVCDTLTEMKLRLAHPWHQSWFENNSNPHAELECLDIFELIALQINDVQFNCNLDELIDNKLNKRLPTFDLNKYLFDHNRITVPDEILLYFLHHYGRRYYNEIIWLADFRGTELFEACVHEMNLQLINLPYIKLSLDDYDNVDQLITRLWTSKHQFTIIMASKFTRTTFKKILACDFVREIYLDVGLGIDYSVLAQYTLDDDEFAGRFDDHKFIFIQNTISTPIRSNEADNFIMYFKAFCGRQSRNFYLILDGVLLNDWMVLDGLALSEISFKRISNNVDKFVQLADCRRLPSRLKFIDCPHICDKMLLLFLESWNSIEIVTITGHTAITVDFFMQYARKQIVQRGLNYFDFRNEEPMIDVEGFEKYTTAGVFYMDDFIADD